MSSDTESIMSSSDESSMSMSSVASKRENVSTIQPYQTMQGHTNSVQGVAHLRDGRHIITCSWDDSIRLWDGESGAQVGDDWRDRERVTIYCIALSPSGKTLASGSADGTVRLWEIEMKNVIAKWNGHTDWVNSVCWSADGGHVASASGDGTVGIWNVEKRETVLGPTKTGHREVYAVAYSLDMSMIATGGRDENAIKTWDAKTGELLSTLKQESAVRSLAWISDQKKLIAGFEYGSIRIFDTATWDQIAILEGHESAVVAISLFHNNRLLASGSWDNTARLWSLDTSFLVGPPLHHRNWVWGVAFSADGKFLATACGDNNAYEWDIHTILKGASLEDLLSVSNVTDIKSILNSDATGRPITKLKNTHTIPHSFFGDSSTPHIDPPPAAVRPNCLSSTTGNESTTNADTPAPTSDPDPPPSIHRRYSVSHARALFRRYALHFRRFQSNTVESTELQQQPSQHVNSVHGPVDVQVPSSPILEHPISQSSVPSPTNVRSRLYHLLNRPSINVDDGLVPIVSVPLGQGQLRTATAGAPRGGNSEYRRDEEFDSPPPSPNVDSQQAPTLAPAQIHTLGEHGNSRLCFCF